MSQANPFEVLALAPTASEEEIVRHAGRLRQRATDEASLDVIRRAVQELTADANRRALWALLAHPLPGHAAPALDRFIAAFRRPPAAQGSSPTAPPLDVAELEALVLSSAAEVLTPGPQQFEPLPAGEDSDEIRRQTAEALWQALILGAGA